MKSVPYMPLRILSPLLLCVTLLLASNSFADALEELTVKANQGDVEAQSILGRRYEYGQGGVSQDYKQAFAWYTKAAHQGSAYAQVKLGLMNQYGQGVPQDYKQAIAWYTKAAYQGDESAQHNLGLMYAKSQGMPPDYKKENIKNDGLWGLIIVGALVVGVIGIWYLIHGFNNHCPSCNKWRSRRVMRTEDLSNTTNYETITRTDVHRNNKGEETGRTYRDEQIRVTYIARRYYNKCASCNHEWNTTANLRTEG